MTTATTGEELFQVEVCEVLSICVASVFCIFAS